MLPSGPNTGPSSHVAEVSFNIATALKVTSHTKRVLTLELDNTWKIYE